VTAPPSNWCIALDDVLAARERIVSHVVRTPLLSSERLDDELGARLLLKCENLQHVGAFKARGATNAVFSLSDERAAAGVVTHSSGNHAAALARAARLRGIAAHIVMPENSRPNKVAAVRAYGVEPVLCEPTAAARHAAAERLREETGATLVHPYDDPHVIAGQGTVGLEIVEQIEELGGNCDAVVIPVGGGGLLAGCLVALHALRPDLPVYAAEPALADDAHRSLASGRVEQPTRYDTVADGLRTPLGELTFPIVRDLVREVLLVDEARIVQATRQLAERAKLVVEPSGAVGVAALVAHADRFRGRRVAVVLTGGNVTLADLATT
jgi:threonine dehydratase